MQRDEALELGQHENIGRKKMVLEQIGSLIAIGKKIIEIAEASKNKELNAVVVQLQEIMMEFQNKGMELQRENARLEEEIQALNEQLRIKATLEFRDNAFWIKDESADYKGPFCPKCWPGDEKLIPLLKYTDPCLTWACSVCNFHVTPGE